MSPAGFFASIRQPQPRRLAAARGHRGQGELKVWPPKAIPKGVYKYLQEFPRAMWSIPDARVSKTTVVNTAVAMLGFCKLRSPTPGARSCLRNT